MYPLSQKDIEELEIFVKYKGRMVPLVKQEVTVERDPNPYLLGGSGDWTLKIEGCRSLKRLNDYIGLMSIEGALEFDPDPYRSAILKVIFNDPATIVFWRDGTKTVVKCQENDKYDKMTGLAMAISKKAFGNKGRYYDIFKKWCEEDA